ncbi:transporter substrate-binding domain-containing protein [Deinococcus sonorensis]|uniref:Transporter substrate-binding domain-containing protein n=2 Tax=Deinococcus sonorensis TaxID=309891 RepID=A0AAU7UFK8_9DEIO
MPGLLTLLLALQGAVHAELADIQKRGEIRIVMSGDYPPFSQPALSGGLEGFDADVAREIATRLKVKPVLIKAEFSSIVAGLQAGNFDLAVASQSKTPERAKAVDFLSQPYYYDGAQLFVPRNSTATSLADLKGKPVAVALGTTFEKFLRAQNYANIVTFQGEPDEYLALGSGRAAGMVTTRTVGSVAAKKGQPIKAVGPVLQQDNPYISLGQNQPKLKAAVEQALDAMRKDGTLKRISEKWIGSDVVTPPKAP